MMLDEQTEPDTGALVAVPAWAVRAILAPASEAEVAGARLALSVAVACRPGGPLEATRQQDRAAQQALDEGLRALDAGRCWAARRAALLRALEGGGAAR